MNEEIKMITYEMDSDGDVNYPPICKDVLIGFIMGILENQVPYTKKDMFDFIRDRAVFSEIEQQIFKELFHSSYSIAQQRIEQKTN